MVLFSVNRLPASQHSAARSIRDRVEIIFLISICYPASLHPTLFIEEIPFHCAVVCQVLPAPVVMTPRCSISELSLKKYQIPSISFQPVHILPCVPSDSIQVIGFSVQVPAMPVIMVPSARNSTIPSRHCRKAASTHFAA